MNRLPFRIWFTGIATIFFMAAVAHFIQYIVAGPPAVYSWII